MTEFCIEQILDASNRLHGHIVKTPLINSPMLDSAVGCEIFAKAESFQKTGTFKFRGALNKILQLSGEQVRRGVVAYSSGNHGLGVAAAAQIVGAPAVIVLPETAISIKIENCRWWGAKIVTYDQATQEREVVAKRFIEELGMTLIPPFDDYDVMAGQGTVGLEICQQMISLGKKPDAIFISCSGGGLSSGVTTSVRHYFPNIECFIAEPFGYEKMARSLKIGSPQRNKNEAKTVMDALIGKIAGERTFKVLHEHRVTAVSVSDEESLDATFAAFHYLKLVLEPGGAAALAAILSRKAELSGKCVAVVCSGGNVDGKIFAHMLSRSH